MAGIFTKISKQVRLFICITAVLIWQPTNWRAMADGNNEYLLIFYANNSAIYQPVALKCDALMSPVDWSHYYNYGSLPTEYNSSISPILIDNNYAVSLDASKERIVVLCSDGKDRLFLRIAVWDEVSMIYSKCDTMYLPDGSYIDSFHDGDSILLCIPLSSAIECGEANKLVTSSVFLTFERLDDRWGLTAFTDGNNYMATLCGKEYVFNHYYEPSDVYEWRVEGPLGFEQFDFMKLLEIVNTYSLFLMK